MWANWEIAALMEWMYDFNQDKPVNEMAGFYGLDMYSMSESFEAIIGYLKKNDQVALQTALKAMDCVEPYARDSGTSFELVPEDCSDDILEMLVKIRERANLYNADPEASFNMNQNARVVQNAERYYRVMHEIGPASWNLRDEHMTDTLLNLLEYHGPESKAIVWEHNTHIGDARATDMHVHGLLNVGQLVREKLADGNTLAVGFGSYHGDVIAGISWGSRMQVMNVPEARDESWESLLHQLGFQEVMLFSTDLRKHGLFNEFIDHRAIGVVYDPTKDHSRNYVPSRIPERYDAFVFLDKTNALHPLKIQPEKREIPDTYPWEL
jgi:erythromycin esterase-like protein